MTGPLQGTNRDTRAAARTAAAAHLGDDQVLAVANLFRMLGDVTRTRILLALVEVGELHVSAIAAAVDKPETSVSHALRLLRTAGIVKSRRQGRSVHYSVADDHVRELLAVPRRHLDHQ